MYQLEMVSFEYAVSVLKKFVACSDSPFIPFEVIWNTSLGLAKARTIIYDDNNFLIIIEDAGYGSIQQEPFNFSFKETDSFILV